MTELLDFPGLRKRLALEPRFGIELVKMAERLGLNPDYIASVMSIESAGTFDPAIRNPNGGATGLIQFMPSTARNLGTTTDTLAAMSAVEQLQYVERFFRQNGQNIRKDVPGDYYMAVFMPAFVGHEPSTVLGVRGSTDPAPGTGTTMGKVYEQNHGFDHDGNGIFTIEDVWNTTIARIASARRRPKIEVPEVSPLPPLPSPRPSWPPVWPSSGGQSDLPVLRVGASGTSVALAQLLLGTTVTGIYTQSMCDIVVKPFQSSHDLTIDGVIGHDSWKALAFSLGPKT